MNRQAIDPYKGPYTLGIDVSKYQGKIDWKRVHAAGIKFAFVRSGDGRSEDSMAVVNLQGAHATGMLVGEYRYFRADRGGTAQAILSDSIVKKSGITLDLPPVLDLELGSSKNLPGGISNAPGDDLPLDRVADEAIECLKELRVRFKLHPIVYSGVAMHFWYSQGAPAQAARFKTYPGWIPSYSKTCRMPVDRTGQGLPWTAWTFWQYTAAGSVDGISGPVDMNRFHGTEDELRQFAKDSIVC